MRSVTPAKRHSKPGTPQGRPHSRTAGFAMCFSKRRCASFHLNFPFILQRSFKTGPIIPHKPEKCKVGGPEKNRDFFAEPA